MADRKIQNGVDTDANEREIMRLRNDMTAQVEYYNSRIAGGKWNGMMPGLVTAKELTSWASQVRWPWGEKPAQSGRTASSKQPSPDQGWRDAAAASRRWEQGAAGWRIVAGLGPTGRAMALLPASLESSWSAGNGPYLEYDFETKGGNAEAYVDFLPTFRIYPGMKLRVAINVDDQAPAFFEIPGSSGAEDEVGAVRSFAVQDNYARLRVPLAGLSTGRHAFRIRAVDPGAVIARVSLP